MCCGTKRLVEIRCPADCAYLASARDHPAAVVVRRHQRDVDVVIHATRDFSERQSHLFVLVAAFLGSRVEEVRGASITAVTDEDVLEAVRALASTYETSSRGVIYDHRPASAIAQRLVTDLKPLFEKVGQAGGSSFDRDAAVVLRRVEQAIEERRRDDPDDRRSFLDLVGRVFSRRAMDEAPGDREADEPRLIVP